MSKFADKAEAIVAEGEAKRKEWTPSGFPLRAYNFWLAESGSKKAAAIRRGDRKENFCHFWRVVVLWSWTNWIGTKFEDFIDWDWSPVVVVSAIVVGLVSIALGAGGLPGLGLLLAIAAGLVAAFAAIVGLVTLTERYPSQATKVGHVLGKVFLGAAALGALAVFIFAFGVVGIVLLAVGAVAGVVIWKNIERIGEWVERVQERNRAAERERSRKRSAELNKFFNEHGYYPSEAPPKEPGRVKKFFRGVGELIVMLAQVARVKKWGVCPLVEVGNEKIDYDSGWETA